MELFSIFKSKQWTQLNVNIEKLGDNQELSKNHPHYSRVFAPFDHYLGIITSLASSYPGQILSAVRLKICARRQKNCEVATNHPHL